MVRKLNQRGSTHLAIVLAVIVIAVAAFAGYRVLNANKDDTAADTTTATSKTTNPPSSISSEKDIDQAAQSLDQENTQNLNSTQFDSDINSML